MPNGAYIELRLSGGSANTDPGASLGGAISSEVIRAQTITASTFGGITYLDAGGNVPTTTARIQYGAPANTLKYSNFSSGDYGAAVDISVDGDYIIFSLDGSGWIKLAKSGTITGTSQTSVAIANAANELFDDVPKSEAADGDVEYRCIYIKNRHGSSSATALAIWVQQQAGLAENIQLGLDPGGKNSTPSAVANENTAPAGVTFANYDSIFAPLSIGTLLAGDYYPVWVRRTVLAEVGPTATSAMSFGVNFV